MDEETLIHFFISLCVLEKRHAFSNNLCHNELVGSSKQITRPQSWLGDNYEKGDCIGINNYPGTSNDLSGCVNDAKDWSALLQGMGFETSLMLTGKPRGPMSKPRCKD